MQRGKGGEAVEYGGAINGVKVAYITATGAAVMTDGSMLCKTRNPGDKKVMPDNSALGTGDGYTWTVCQCNCAGPVFCDACRAVVAGGGCSCKGPEICDTCSPVKIRVVGDVEQTVMERNVSGDTCPACGAQEIDAMSPRTVYACGSSDYDRRPGTFKRGKGCTGGVLAWCRRNPTTATCLECQEAAECPGNRPPANDNADPVPVGINPELLAIPTYNPVRVLPDPTPEMLEHPVFNAIWGVIKHWDINVPDAYVGYCGATGNHARAIFDVVNHHQAVDSGVEPLPSLAERLRQALGKAIEAADGYCMEFHGVFPDEITIDMRALANGELLAWTPCKACDLCAGKKCPAHPAYMRPDGTILPRAIKPERTPCGCDPAANIVCPTCEALADKNVEDMREYVLDFITKRFPSGLEGDIRRIITEIILDAFHDGARWCEKVQRSEMMIIEPGALQAQPDSEPSKIILASR